ncbi:MAG: T9SS type A sorting domain-containing protein [Flavobacteriales bacterium]
MYLQNGSPSLNAGENTGVQNTDIKGDLRINENTADMGVYEHSNTVSVNEKVNTNSLRIYPNPANENVIIESKENGVIMIYNAMGQNFSSSLIVSDNIHGKIIINTLSLANGIYLVTVNGSSTVLSVEH